MPRTTPPETERNMENMENMEKKDRTTFGYHLAHEKVQYPHLSVFPMINHISISISYHADI